jgi:hypothetical protein
VPYRELPQTVLRFRNLFGTRYKPLQQATGPPELFGGCGNATRSVDERHTVVGVSTAASSDSASAISASRPLTMP